LKELIDAIEDNYLGILSLAGDILFLLVYFSLIFFSQDPSWKSLPINEILSSRERCLERALVDIGTPPINAIVHIARHYHGLIPLGVFSLHSTRDLVVQYI
jgi:hypothetical protein